MRQKLALIMALAGFAALTALGVGMAGADPSAPGLGDSQAAKGILTTPALPSSQAPACANEVDDDGDGLVDLEDPDCESASDTSEEAEAPAESEAPAKPKPVEKVHTGASLNAAEASGGDGSVGGVQQNQSLGTSNAPSGGGVSAPSATAGDQPQAESSNGGSQFGNGGAPTSANPTTTIAPFGPAPLGVPNFVIDSFEIPPFLLPIYQACGTEYGIPWEVLASINKIETAFGTNMGPSTAGALGWMQFMPSSWEEYGLDANGDGRKDPYNPVDAICAAAHYLKVAGGSGDLYHAIFAYNHADWYVQEVLLYARAYGKLPTELVGSLTGLTEGAHFPVAADARYADDISARAALSKATPKVRKEYGNAAEVISSSPTRRGINIFASEGSPVVAVNDGVIKKLGSSKKLGRFLVLEDAYGNRFTYAELGRFVRHHRSVVASSGSEERVPTESQNLRPRLYALPGRVDKRAQEDARVGAEKAVTGTSGTLDVGSRVIAGTVLARIGAGEGGVDPHINFSIRPAGRGAPRIDPKPILDGWKLLEATAIYSAKGENPLTAGLGGAGVLLLSKEALEQRVLADKQLSIYPCGRTDIATGQIDRRVLAMLEYLSAKGFQLGITALKCGHSYLTTSGNVSEHSTGGAVDIAEIDGVPVTGHQGPGTLTDELIKTVLQLQGTMQPHQVISLEDLPGETSFALPDHYDHVHVGYSPGFEAEYVSPFVSATQGRIDQGVDFTGAGPILAVGDAQILATGALGWPEGGGVLYRLLDGPEAGRVIFVYEGVQATVRAGDRVSAGQQIATFVAGGSIEMGFADENGVPLSHAEYNEGDETVWGHRMADFLSSLGGSSALFPGFGELAPDKWDRLIKRLGKIENPTVPSGPSKYSLPAGKDKPGVEPGKSPAAPE
ncbi:MAG TPA: lytic murein transglycosylase [Solirubrobacterales bacterium]|nr:lytic murein transglycosylase [Solirubrobacterales bacterium]